LRKYPLSIKEINSENLNYKKPENKENKLTQLMTTNMPDGR